MTLLPDSMIVAASWLANVPGITGNQIATVLPKDTSTWAANGFVQITVVGGAPVIESPLFRPVVQVDAWAVNANSDKPPWGKAAQLGQRILQATYDMSNQEKRLTFGSSFNDAQVLTVYPITEPRRVWDPDKTGYARTTVDLQFTWRPISL